MKLVKKIILLIVIFSLLFVAVFFAYSYYQKPKYEGKITSNHIQKTTTVYFDAFGVPHIYAQSQQDAMTVLGYVHAQDRLWQMELLRRIAPGKLSEIFGTKALKSDIFFAGIGINEASENAIAQLDTASQSYILSNAYLNGINQYIKEGKTPIELQLLGIKQEKFILKDIYNIFGYMSFSFAMAQKTDPLLTSIRDQFGMQYLEDFGIDGRFNTIKLKSHNSLSDDYIAVSKSIATLLNQSVVPPFVGSNSWVIAPQKTKNGKVIFANDPHIVFSQPCTWYETHIVTPDYEMYGFYLAGTPFPLLGHNRQYAYGLTMFENDDIDFFKEVTHPNNANQYKTTEGWKDFITKQKTIKVKDSLDVVLPIKLTQHGPIMNGLLDGLNQKNPIAMSWIYTQQPLHILDAVYGIAHAKNRDDFQKSVRLIAAPGLNVMYGDAKGNVAWFASGKLYKKSKTVNTNFILDGTSKTDTQSEFLDFSKNPSAVNPPWHYVYSANNQPLPIDGYLYPGYYLPEDRAKRIDQLLESKNDWDKKSVSAMINDNVSAVSPIVVQNLIRSLDVKLLTTTEKIALSALVKWKHNNDLEAIGPTIYNKWVYLVLKNTFYDEMGEERFRLFLGTHIMKQIIAPQIGNKNSVWWDNIATINTKETQSQIITKSYHEAILSLENQLGTDVLTWQWQRVHTLEHQHPLGSIALLKPLFNVGVFKINGSNEVINNQFFDFAEDGQYKVKGGPSTRRIIDFSDIENASSILPTGQSGNPFSPHYSDQAQMYNDGKFRKMMLNKNEITKTGTKLVFEPN